MPESTKDDGPVIGTFVVHALKSRVRTRDELNGDGKRFCVTPLEGKHLKPYSEYYGNLDQFKSVWGEPID